MEVWYKLDDHEASSLMFEGNHVDHLMRAIKEEAANTLKGVDTFLLRAYAADADPSKDKHLPGDRKVPNAKLRRMMSLLS